MHVMDDSASDLARRDSRWSSQVWNVLGKRLPQNEVVFFSQVILVYIVVVACIVNLTRGADDSNLWTCLLSSCLGYILPNPKLTAKKQRPAPSPPSTPPSP